MTERPVDDRELMRELDALSEAYGRQTSDAPPAAVDAAVLARARAAAGRRRVPAWWIPATLAATVVIAFSLMLRVQEESAMVPAMMDATGPGADRAAPAAPAGTSASAEVAEAAPQVAAQSPPAAPPPPARSFEAEPAGDMAEADAARATSVTPRADVAALRAPANAKSAGPPDPQAWLEMIEALEVAGRMEEAAAERARLEAAYPGWLEQRSGRRD